MRPPYDPRSPSRGETPARRRWDGSELSDYTHHTAYSLKRIQASLRNVVAD